VYVYPVILLGGKGVKVSMPFINTFQKEKNFFSADFAKDTKVANTYPSEFLHTLKVSGMLSRCLFVRSSSLGVRG
jgi:hypothetical protein